MLFRSVMVNINRTFVLREIGAIVLKATYGYSIESNGSDPLVNLAEKGMNIFSLSVGTPWVVDSIPIRKSHSHQVVKQLSDLTRRSALVTRMVPRWRVPKYSKEMESGL